MMAIRFPGLYSGVVQCRFPLAVSDIDVCTRFYEELHGLFVTARILRRTDEWSIALYFCTLTSAPCDSSVRITV